MDPVISIPGKLPVLDQSDIVGAVAWILTTCYGFDLDMLIISENWRAFTSCSFNSIICSHFWCCQVSFKG